MRPNSTPPRVTPTADLNTLPASKNASPVNADKTPIVPSERRYQESQSSRERLYFSNTSDVAGLAAAGEKLNAALRSPSSAINPPVFRKQNQDPIINSTDAVKKITGNIARECNDPLKTCSVDNPKRKSNEHGHGRRI